MYISLGDLSTEAEVHLYENIQSKQHGAFVAGIKNFGKLLQLSPLTEVVGKSIPKGDQVCFQTNVVKKGYHAVSVFQKGLKKISIAYVVYW
jgi:hypothetical protein